MEREAIDLETMCRAGLRCCVLLALPSMLGVWKYWEAALRFDNGGNDTSSSFSPQAALTLPRRPFLHCSTVIPIAVLSVKLAVHLFKLRDSWRFLPWMILVSWTSHHIRDGIRHGLWICPFGKTPPLPSSFYVISTLSLPHLCSFLMYLTGTRQTVSSKYGMRIDVWDDLICGSKRRKSLRWSNIQVKFIKHRHFI